MAAPRSGTTTVLFSDIEGSTDLIQRIGDVRYSEVLAEHRRVLRATFAEGGGTEIRTEGDAFFAAFRRAGDAVASAIAAQRALLAHPWAADVALRVRMGLHTGEPVSVASDYVGLDVHRVARICAAGHGGQILLSISTALLVEDKLPAGASLRDLGLHRLKDVREPERIFQVVHPGLPSEFPALRSLDTVAHNLPRQLNSFVGRARELAEVKRLLSTAALLTLTGSGGCGKTRLALQLARDVLEDHPHGVWLVELAALTDPELVPQTVARALGVREDSGRPLIDTLVDHLRTKRLLLILDNCEHLIAACAVVAEQLLRACRSLTILATSREPLRISGEIVWRVPSLSFPEHQPLPSSDTLTEYEAIRLFVERATAVHPAFALTPQNAAPVATICRRLDGIPLAIELAAARTQVLSVEQIDARLNDRFRLLGGASRTTLPRHQTLQGAMDWSYALLSAGERVMLRRLAVFAGGWTVEAAQAVCTDDGGPGDALDLLTGLVLKSLVVVGEQAGQARYRFLDTVRQYACERLLESGEGDVLRSRHLGWSAQLAETAEPELIGAGQVEWLNRLDTEHDNVRAALEWSLESGAIETGLRLASAARRFWYSRDYLAEGRRWLDALLEKSGGVAPARHAKALKTVGQLAFWQADYAYCRRVYEESLAIWRQVGNTQEVATLLGELAALAFGQGDFRTARALYQESLVIRREMGDTWAIALSLHNLGRVVYREGDLTAARALMEEGLALWRGVGDKQNIAGALTNLGFVAFSRGDYVAARSLFDEGLTMQEELGDKRRIAYSLMGFAFLAAAQGHPERAARLFGAEEALREAIGAPLPRVDRSDYERIVAAARSRLGKEDFAAAWAAGRAMTLGAAIGAAKRTD
ncbi:MAG TPA: tetratricopeptide repeat protein [bacterium]|nr:tetratricopeptide repeat protein [bacterium]